MRFLAIQILRDGFHGPSIFEFTSISRLEIVKVRRRRNRRSVTSPPSGMARTTVTVSTVT